MLLFEVPVTLIPTVIPFTKLEACFPISVQIALFYDQNHQNFIFYIQGCPQQALTNLSMNEDFSVDK